MDIEATNKTKKPNDVPVTEPISPNTKTNQKRILLIPIGIIVILIILAFGGFIISSSSKQNNSILPQGNSNQNANQNANTKSFTNDYYHIKLDIPADWTVENGTRQDGLPTFKLSSPDKEIIIESPLADKNNYIKQDLPNPEVQLGQYKVNRSRYINADDETIDYISLINIPQQKTINLSLTVSGDFEANNQKLLKILKTFAFTQKETSLDEFITYTVPEGWNKGHSYPFSAPDPSHLIFLSTNDYSHDQAMGLTQTGATIRATRYMKNPNRTLLNEIKSSLPSPISKNTNIVPVKIDGLDGFNAFSCWEGCWDTYYIEKDNYWWQITFECAECSTKALVNANQYAKDRDKFINSVKFK